MKKVINALRTLKKGDCLTEDITMKGTEEREGLMQSPMIERRKKRRMEGKRTIPNKPFRQQRTKKEDLVS